MTSKLRNGFHRDKKKTHLHLRKPMLEQKCAVSFFYKYFVNVAVWSFGYLICFYNSTYETQLYNAREGIEHSWFFELAQWFFQVIESIYFRKSFLLWIVFFSPSFCFVFFFFFALKKWNVNEMRIYKYDIFGYIHRTPPVSSLILIDHCLPWRIKFAVCSKTRTSFFSRDFGRLRFAIIKWFDGWVFMCIRALVSIGDMNTMNGKWTFNNLICECVSLSFFAVDTFVKMLWGVIFYSNSNAHFFFYNSLIWRLFSLACRRSSFALCQMVNGGNGDSKEWKKPKMNK